MDKLKLVLAVKIILSLCIVCNHKNKISLQLFFSWTEKRSEGLAQNTLSLSAPPFRMVETYSHPLAQTRWDSNAHKVILASLVFNFLSGT